MEQAVINTIECFADRRSSVLQNSKSPCFVRLLGWNGHCRDALLNMDAKLSQQMRAGKLYYARCAGLPKLLSAEEAERYKGCCDCWAESGKKIIRTRQDSISRTNDRLAMQLGEACRKAAEIYRRRRDSVTDSMMKNFIVKLLYWHDFVLGGLRQWNADSCIKVVADNAGKEQEYLFYYFLAQAGCDVLLLQSREDVQGAQNQALSKAAVIGEFSHAEIPAYRPCAGPEDNTGRVIVKIPRHPGRHSQQEPQHRQDFQYRQDSRCRKHPISQPAAEKSFEQLAALASSIVMITVYDKDGKSIGAGSGIMAGRDGYILTNDHVARGGYSYSVRIENDSTEYRTDELIKYNTMLDLALLRIQRKLNPLPVYDGAKKLARGQTVVAIGSPLGLFNSVSNGIISGFRMIDGVEMIQFTAPISSGSSGGAVLNMQGDVIGISTAGFDRGQNINLAVGYENIRMFLRGFL